MTMSMSSLLVYTNIIDFCMFILYPVTLVNLLVSCGMLSCRFLRMFYKDNHVSPNRDNFFPLWFLLFISFSWHVVLSITSSSMWNKTGKSRNPWLILGIGVKASSLSPLIIMLSETFCIFALSNWRSSFLFLFYWDLYHEWVLNFVKYFLCSKWCDRDFPPPSHPPLICWVTSLSLCAVIYWFFSVWIFLFLGIINDAQLECRHFHSVFKDLEKYLSDLFKWLSLKLLQQEECWCHFVIALYVEV